MELTSVDWVNASLTEELLAREGPLQPAASPRALQELILLGQRE